MDRSHDAFRLRQAAGSRLLHDICLRLLQEEEVREGVETPGFEPTALHRCSGAMGSHPKL